MPRLFTLQESEAHLSNVNHRIEKFGDEGNKLACDLEISFDTSNDYLAQFYPDPSKPTTMGKIDAMLEDGGITISLARPLDDAPEMVSNEPELNPVEKRGRKLKPHERNPEMFADPDEALH